MIAAVLAIACLCMRLTLDTSLEHIRIQHTDVMRMNIFAKLNVGI